MTPPHIHIYTFREGLLSRVGHDLLFALDVPAPFPQDGERLSVSLPVHSLRLVAAMQADRPAPDLLSPRDRADILQNLRGPVLQAARFPVIQFAGSRRPHALQGNLTLCGVSRPISIPLQNGEGSLNLDQRDFGIPPFKALMGTLRVQPVVRIHIRLPS